MACCTRWRAESLTRRVPFITCETVVNETPARAATCLMVLNRSLPAGRIRHVVGHLDLAGDDVCFGGIDLLLHVGRNELLVVLVEGIVDAVLLEAEVHE